MLKGLLGIFALLGLVGGMILWIIAMHNRASDDALFDRRFRLFCKREHFTPKGYKIMLMSYILFEIFFVCNVILWCFVMSFHQVKIDMLRGIFLTICLFSLFGSFVFWFKAMNRRTSDDAIFKPKFKFICEREHFSKQGYKFMVIAYSLFTVHLVCNTFLCVFIYRVFD